MINYFLVEGKERKGPFTKEQVLLFYKNLRINNSTLIWREGLDGWVKIQDLEEFRVKPKASSQIKTKEEDLKIPAPNKNQFTAFHNKSDSFKILLAALPLAFFLSFLLKNTFLKWVMWISSMWVHEIGHSFSGWLGSRFMFPVPFLATFGSPVFNALGIVASFILVFLGYKHNKKVIIYGGVWVVIFFASYYFYPKEKLIVYSLFLMVFISLIKISNNFNMKFFSYLGVIFLFLQWYMTFFLDSESWDMIMIFSGIGGEFVIGTLFVVLFYYKFPETVRWDFFRYFFLIVGAYSLLSATIDWHTYASDYSLMPFGTALAGSNDPHGDLNLLRDKFKWSEAVIVSRYALLSKICMIAVAGHYLYFLFKGVSKKTS